MAQLALSAFADEAAPDLDGQVQALQENGVGYLELRHVGGVNVADFSADQTRDIAKALAAKDLKVSCLGSPIGKMNLKDPFPPHEEAMKRLCQTAQTLKAPYIRIFSFYLPAGQTPADCRQEVLERLDRLLSIAASEGGPMLLHENERDIYGDIPERCLDLQKELGGRLGAILDPANYLLVEADPYEAMLRLEPWVEYLHIKDVRCKDQRIVPAGMGDGRLPEIIDRMRLKEGQRFLSVEPHLTHFDGRDQLEQDSSQTPDDDFAYEDGFAAFRAAVSACRQIVEKGASS